MVVCGGGSGGECDASGEEVGRCSGGISAGGGGQGEGDGLGIFRDIPGDGGVDEFEAARLGTGGRGGEFQGGSGGGEVAAYGARFEG